MAPRRPRGRVRLRRPRARAVSLFLEEEVERVRAAEDVPDVTLRSTEGDEWTIGVGTTEVSGDRAALLGWLARGLTTGVAGDPLPQLPAGR